MGLRPEQKSQLLQERRRLLETMGCLLQERQMIQALIKASLTASAVWLHAFIQATQPSTVLALVRFHTTQQAPHNLYAYVSMRGS